MTADYRAALGDTPRPMLPTSTIPGVTIISANQHVTATGVDYAVHADIPQTLGCGVALVTLGSPFPGLTLHGPGGMVDLRGTDPDDWPDIAPALLSEAVRVVRELWRAEA